MCRLEIVKNYRLRNKVHWIEICAKAFVLWMCSSGIKVFYLTILHLQAFIKMSIYYCNGNFFLYWEEHEICMVLVCCETSGTILCRSFDTCQIGSEKCGLDWWQCTVNPIKSLTLKVVWKAWGCLALWKCVRQGT